MTTINGRWRLRSTAAPKMLYNLPPETIVPPCRLEIRLNNHYVSTLVGICYMILIIDIEKL